MRVKFKVNTATVDRKKWDWCKHHKAEGLFEGIFLPHPHNHDEWKQKGNKWNYNRINQRNLNAENETGQPSATSKTKKLTLPKALLTVLTTKLCVSNADASIIIEDALKESGSDYARGSEGLFGIGYYISHL